PGAAIGGYAIIGGAAVLAASMQGPLSAIVLMLELTHTADGLMVPIQLAVAEATIVARLLGAPSIYSARLQARSDAGEPAESVGPLQALAPGGGGFRRARRTEPGRRRAPRRRAPRRQRQRRRHRYARRRLRAPRPPWRSRGDRGSAAVRARVTRSD